MKFSLEFLKFVKNQDCLQAKEHLMIFVNLHKKGMIQK